MFAREDNNNVRDNIDSYSLILQTTLIYIYWTFHQSFSKQSESEILLQGHERMCRTIPKANQPTHEANLFKY